MLALTFILVSTIFLIAVSLFIRNMVYLVFILLLTFICMSSVLFLFSDFLGLLFLLIYSGGLSVLFIFVCFSITIQKREASVSKNKILFMCTTTFAYLKSIFFFSMYNLKYHFILTNFQLNLFLVDLTQYFNLLFVNYYCIPTFIALILLSALLGSVSCFRQDLDVKKGTNRFL